MTSAPSNERTAPGGARATRPRTHPETPSGIKVVAGMVALGAVGDAFVGLLTVGSTTILGVLLLGVAVAELYLGYGLYHLQGWAYRGTFAAHGALIVILLFLGWWGPALFKGVLAAYLLARRDAGWY